MLTAVKPVLQVLLAVVFMEAGLGILSPLVGLHLASGGAPATLVGLAFSAYFGGFLVGTLTCHRLIDRVGHIRAFAVFAAFGAILTLLHLLIRDPYAWLVIRAVMGYAVAGMFVIVESWLNDKATEDNRGRIFAVYMAVSWAASGISPLALNIHDPQGQLLFCLVTIFFALALIPMALTRVGNPEIGHRNHFGILRLFKISPTGVTVCFGSGMINTSIYALLPVYTEATGLTAGQLSILLAVVTIAGLVVQFPVGYLSDHFGRRPIMLASSAAAAAMATMIAFWPSPSFLVLVLLMFVMDGVAAPLYALGVGQTNDYVTKKDFVAASAGLLFAWGLGAAIGPTVIGLAMDPLGANGLFIVCAVGYTTLALFVAIRMLLRPAPSPKEQSDFVAVPVTQGTYGAPELDPRGEYEQFPHRKVDEE
ncbi:MAG: MFS transporter [Dongiaceae bacterium]